MNDFERGSITVSLVMVSPKGVATAWGHSESGACVEFSSDTAAMIQLFHTLRNSSRDTAHHPVVVDAAEYCGVHEIPPSQCPLHMLPDIPPDSIVAFSPY